MKKPDRFARMVDGIGLGDGHKRALWEKECTRLLRAEHKAVFRLVKQQTILAGNVIDRNVLIAALARRTR